jgi:transcriptional regulator with XRE-family HTH domain
MEMSDSLRACRQHYRQSGVNVAAALKMSAAAYRRYERGEVVPSAEIIMKLAKLYGCSLNAVLITGGIEEDVVRNEVRENLDVKINEGETLTITINASIGQRATSKTPKDTPYKPSIGIEKKNKKKAGVA